MPYGTLVHLCFLGTGCVNKVQVQGPGAHAAPLVFARLHCATEPYTVVVPSNGPCPPPVPARVHEDLHPVADKALLGLQRLQTMLMTLPDGATR